MSFSEGNVAESCGRGRARGRGRGRDSAETSDELSQIRAERQIAQRRVAALSPSIKKELLQKKNINYNYYSY
ncbi:unnamed protein product, partial [Iphiclides podalirius]